MRGRSSGEDDNLIIHGDNLDAPKALLPCYAHRVKGIYIDPLEPVNRPGVLGGGVPGKEYAAVNWPGGDVARYGGFALGVDRPGYDQQGGDEGGPREGQGKKNAASE